MGDKKDWDKAEKALNDALKKCKLDYKINKGDGAFYGPKIDLHIKDSLGRSWQMGTIQLDMQMPKRFGLNYISKNNKEETPIIIHRAIFGSIERFIGVLLEHTNGILPTWLSPIQVRVVNFTDRNVNSCNKFIENLKKKVPMIRIDTDYDSVPLGGKIRNAELMRISYVIVIGDKEEKENFVAVRKRGEKNPESMSAEKFIKTINEEIKERR